MTHAPLRSDQCDSCVPPILSLSGKKHAVAARVLQLNMLLLNVLQLAGAPGGSNACAETLCARSSGGLRLAVCRYWLEIAERFALCMHLLRFGRLSADVSPPAPASAAMRACSVGLSTTAARAGFALRPRASDARLTTVHLVKVNAER